MRVVPGLDELEDGHSGFRLGPEPAPVEKLALQSGKEALAQGIVEAVADRAGGPVEGRTSASLHRFPKAIDVYWHP